MERIVYRKTLDVHKSGVQFMLQGFETADKLSRVIEVSLMASGDAIDFPLESIIAMMYVNTPNSTEPSINECTIKDNKIIYDVLPIVEEGITTMQLKLVETSPEGATSVLAAPKFAVEVTKSDTDDESVMQTTTFTALEAAMAKAQATYDKGCVRIELTSDCMFRAYYNDGTYYETDLLSRIFVKGDTQISKSYAVGNTGIRENEDIDNAKYYYNVAKSEANKASSIMANNEEILKDVRTHGVYTAFTVDFATGNVEYVSPSFDFKINEDSGELIAIPKTYTYEKTIAGVVEDWLKENNIETDTITTHGYKIIKLEETSVQHSKDISDLKINILPIERGGTGKTTKGEALKALGGVSADYVDQKIGTGTYTGNGTYGPNNPVTITYATKPKMIVIQCNYNSDTFNTLILVGGSGYATAFPDASISGTKIECVKCQWEDTKVSFYVKGNTYMSNPAELQMNAKCEYKYVIFY